MSQRHSSTLITLTTDFGVSSPYVAQMKGVILGLNQAVTPVDLTHRIRAQNVQEAAVVLCDTAPQFPPQTIHVCVVDPGVGTQRGIVYAELGEQRFIAPDNGVLSLMAQRAPLRLLITLTVRDFWRHEVSHTFHGRDIMASVAAHLSLGVAPDRLGPQQAALETLAWPAVTPDDHALRGSIIAVDSFGNLISNVTRAMLPAQPPLSRLSVELADQIQATMVRTYAEAAPGCCVALFGSSDRLEVAIVNGHAASELSADVGTRLRVSWPKE